MGVEQEPKYIQKLREVSKGAGHRYRTTESYVRQVKDYEVFCRSLPPGLGLSSSEKLQRYLSHRAPHVAVSTQKVILNALVFFYRYVMREQNLDIGPFAQAQVPKRLPVWLSPREVTVAFAEMSGIQKLQAQLCFGAGLRLMECIRLRIKDIDYDSGIITVRDGKGGKDRSTCLPPSLVEPLRAQIFYARQLHERDRRSNTPGVMLPEGVARKYPKYGVDWAWFWLWPGKSLSTDPASGIVRRHHVHETSLQKEFRKACQHAGIAKRVTVHSLRHSFATQLLMQGVDIYQVSKLLGHSDIKTTAVYLHCIPQFASSVTSPLERLSDVIQFPKAAAPVSSPVAL